MGTGGHRQMRNTEEESDVEGEKGMQREHKLKNNKYPSMEEKKV
jgi:hypothetical protein